MNILETGGTTIDPTRIAQGQEIVAKAFDAWYDKDWSLALTREQFDRTSSASFLAYLRHILNSAGPDGVIDLESERQKLQEELGEDYRPEKMEKAVYFLTEEEDWSVLLS